MIEEKRVGYSTLRDTVLARRRTTEMVVFTIFRNTALPADTIAATFLLRASGRDPSKKRDSQGGWKWLKTRNETVAI